jgi:nucleoside-diphosphate-sugar epimerase
MKDHPGTLVVVGASDFFGPGVSHKSVLGDTITGKIVKGQSALAIGSVKVIHDFCFAPDFSKSLALVATEPKAYDRFWICPHSIHGKTIQEVGDDMAKAAGQETPVKFTVFGIWMLRLMSPFMSFLGEMIEMLPLWTQDYKVDDSDFIQTFGMQATPYDEAIQAYVDYYKAKDA